MEPPAKKRATIACNYCRKRKRKCDGRQPVCSLCEESNDSRCVYQELPSKQVAGQQGDQTSVILERLEHLEQFVVNIASSQNTASFTHPFHGNTAEASLSEPSPASRGAFSLSAPTPDTPGICQSVPTPAASAPPPASLVGEDSFRTSAAMTIPIAHSTTTGDLLRSGVLKSFLGDYPPYILTRVEAKRFSPPRISLSEASKQTDGAFPNLGQSETKELINVFFNTVAVQHPVLDKDKFMALYNKVVEEGAHLTNSSCLVLVVLALGAIAQVASSQDTRVDSPPGVDFFEPALGHIMIEWPMFFGDDIALPQAMYLSSLYFGYLSRPLQAWRLVHMAATSAQHVSLWANPSQDMVRLCWATFILECDILAEHHLPRSGIEQFVDNMPFPNCGNPPTNHMLSWLANISSRKLLNRIHHALYDQSNRNSSTGPHLDDHEPSFRVCEELASQLHAWFDLLPEPIKPRLGTDQETPEQATLAMRYHAAGDIIFRPFLLQALRMATLDLPIPPSILNNAKECLLHCRRYISAVEFRLKQPSASLEIFLHSTLASILLLTQASLCPEIADPAAVEIPELQDKVIGIFENWTSQGSSIEAMLSIIRAIKSKHQMLK